MAVQRKLHYSQDLQEKLVIHYGDIVFNADNNGVVIDVDLLDGGEAAEMGGTVAGAVICPDGSTVALTGSSSGNTVSIALDADCVAIPGQIGVGIQVVNGTTKTTVFKGVYNVDLFETNNPVDPGSRTALQIGDLIDDIETAIASIPADYSDLLAAIAPTFSNATAYAAGQYVWYDGDLYRFTTAHTAGSWNSAHVSAAVLGNDLSALNGAFEDQQPIVIGAKTLIFKSGYFTTPAVGSAVSNLSSNTMVCAYSKVQEGDAITLDATGVSGTSRLFVWIDANGNALNRCSTNLSGKRTIVAPENAVAVGINNYLTSQPTGYYAYIGTTVDERLATKQGTLTFDTAPTENSTNPVTSGGVYTAVENAKTAENQVAHDNAVYGGLAYWPVSPASGVADDTLTISQSGGYVTLDGTHTKVYAYAKLDKAFGVGSATSTGGGAAQKALAKDTVLKAGKSYKVSLDIISGTYTAGATSSKIRLFMYDTNDNTVAEVLAGNSANITVSADTMVSVVLSSYGANNTFVNYKLAAKISDNVVDTSPIQDSLNPISSGAVYDIVQSLPEDETIPAYYFENDYLQGKIDAITGIQNTISVNNDAFWFISDYHEKDNEKHSLPMLKYLMKYTGITKLIYGGDAGGSAGTGQSAVYHQIQKSAEVWQKMDDIAKNFYGVIGNHEYINSTYGKFSGMMGAYLNRYKNNVIMDGATGCYYVDNVANKIRMYFLQDNSTAYPVTGALTWFKNQLLEVPADYSILVVMHYGYVPNTVTNLEFNGYDPTYGHSEIKDVSELLAGVRDKTDLTSTLGVDFSSLTGVRHIIGIFGGHIHHGYLYTESTVSDIEDVAVFEASTDSLLGGLQELSINGHPWFWEGGIVGGTQIERTAGTIYEQCFYAVQIDLDAKRLYIIAIGGDHDWSGYYEPESV